MKKTCPRSSRRIQINVISLDEHLKTLPQQCSKCIANDCHCCHLFIYTNIIMYCSCKFVYLYICINVLALFEYFVLCNKINGLFIGTKQHFPLKTFKEINNGDFASSYLPIFRKVLGIWSWLAKFCILNRRSTC